MARRRDLVRWGLAGLLGGVLPGGTAVLASRRGSAPTAAPGAPSGAAGPPAGAFTVPLPVPEVLRPVSTDGGIDRYEIRQQVARQLIRPDTETEIWGYQGSFPGPTIEARRGREVRVTHHNELPVPTVVHLHGGVVTQEHDGFPADFILPPGGGWESDPLVSEHAAYAIGGVESGSRTYHYPNDQRAATLWYHDHRMRFSGPQQYRGLAGFYLIRDDVEDGLPLPRGARELPLMVADRAFAEDGSLFYPSRDPTLREPGVDLEHQHSGMLGDTVVVNGVAWPYYEVDAALYRLRIVNASNARVYELRLDPPPPGGGGLVQIGSDLGLLGRPLRHDRLRISPGERYDLLVDFSAYGPGASVTVRNTGAQGPPSYVMRFDVVRRVADDDARVPESLAPDEVDRSEPAAYTVDRTFGFFSGPEGIAAPSLINMLAYEGDRVDARPEPGDTEIWDVTGDPQHPVHLHVAHFRVLRRDGGTPDPQDAGLKDTVFVPSGGVRLAVTFPDLRGKYVFHCHNLEHADNGMMANMEIV